MELCYGIAGVRPCPSSWTGEGRICKALGREEYDRGAHAETAGFQERCVQHYVSHSIIFKNNANVFPGLADAALGEGAGVKRQKLLSVKEIKAVRVPFSAIPLSLSTSVV